MLRKQVSIGLFALLLCHTLASAIVGVVNWWQAETDLSERLLVYRSVDSLLEFQIPLKDYCALSDSALPEMAAAEFAFDASPIHFG